MTYADAVENIDIGGPSMLRSAAKNHASVTVVVDPADYTVVLDELSANGETTYETRQRLAAKVFRHTAAYDALIAEYFTAQVAKANLKSLPWPMTSNKLVRYGENPQQDADFYQKLCQQTIRLLQPNSSTVRNYLLTISVMRMLPFVSSVTSKTVQPLWLSSMNPCGIGQADDIETAWDYAYESDPVSIFGGIVVLNGEVDTSTAEKMRVFLEIIIAPSYTDEALAI